MLLESLASKNMAMNWGRRRMGWRDWPLKALMASLRGSPEIRKYN